VISMVLYKACFVCIESGGPHHLPLHFHHHVNNIPTPLKSEVNGSCKSHYASAVSGTGSRCLLVLVLHKLAAWHT